MNLLLVLLFFGCATPLNVIKAVIVSADSLPIKGCSDIDWLIH